MKLGILLLSFALPALGICDSKDPRQLRDEFKVHRSVELEYNESDVVFTGKVVDSTPVSDKDGFLLGTYYSVVVSERLKGSAPNKEILYDENSSGRFDMFVGKKYLIFAYHGVFDGAKGMPLAIDAVGNSGELEASSANLEKSRRLRDSTPLK
jgi:hypothetical protein